MKYTIKNIFSDETLKSLEETIGKDAFDKLINAEIDSANERFIPQEKFNEANEKVKNLSSQINDRDNQIKELSKFKGTTDELNSKIAELTKANEDAMNKYKADMLAYKTATAWDKALNSANSKNAKALKGMIDASKVTYDEEKNELIGFNEQVASIRKENEWLFTSQNPVNGGFAHQQANAKADQTNSLESAIRDFYNK